VRRVLRPATIDKPYRGAGNMKKTVYTLNVDNYAPGICAITYPLMRYYARKIGADFVEITSRAWPHWPVVCEKFQVGQLAAQRNDDFAIFFDADTLIHPETVDFSAFLPVDTCLHNGVDFAAIRHRYDAPQLADKRNIGTCGWFTAAPRACFGLWDLPDISMDEIISRCSPTLEEAHAGVTAEHLTDDFIMSRNLALHGYKHTTVAKLLPEIGLPGAEFFWHIYTVGIAEKVRQMKEILWRWKVPHPALFEGWDWLFERMK
jgi:hypothetical protein